LGDSPIGFSGSRPRQKGISRKRGRHSPWRPEKAGAGRLSWGAMTASNLARAKKFPACLGRLAFQTGKRFRPELPTFISFSFSHFLCFLGIVENFQDSENFQLCFSIEATSNVYLNYWHLSCSCFSNSQPSVSLE
jgi:hypothetical protein